jgi:hypothetical protein
MKQERDRSRREFIQQSAVLGTGMILAGAAAQLRFDTVEFEVIRRFT